jgi:Arp2/3 complex, 34 kD subunit p34-Arc
MGISLTASSAALYEELSKIRESAKSSETLLIDHRILNSNGVRYRLVSKDSKTLSIVAIIPEMKTVSKEFPHFLDEIFSNYRNRCQITSDSDSVTIDVTISSIKTFDEVIFTLIANLKIAILSIPIVNTFKSALSNENFAFSLGGYASNEILFMTTKGAETVKFVMVLIETNLENSVLTRYLCTEMGEASRTRSDHKHPLIAFSTRPDDQTRTLFPEQDLSSTEFLVGYLTLTFRVEFFSSKEKIEVASASILQLRNNLKKFICVEKSHILQTIRTRTAGLESGLSERSMH